jgi:hypothetical protein
VEDSCLLSVKLPSQRQMYLLDANVAARTCGKHGAQTAIFKVRQHWTEAYDMEKYMDGVNLQTFFLAGLWHSSPALPRW